MSWWDTGNGDDVIGDRPADLLTAALPELPAPSLAELLEAVSQVLREHGENLVADPDDARDAVVVTDPPVIEDNPRPPREAVTERLLGAFRDIAAVYDDRWERRPRVSELLALLAFVLRPRPRPWLSEGGDALVRDVVVR